MRKSWLALVLGLSIFALMGADCDQGGNIEPDRGPLPPRALAATPLLRTYYQTQFIPKDMRPIKIPEGDAFSPDRLTLLFDMGGDERVVDVRLRVTVGAPLTAKESTDPDLFGRVIAPNGTASAWKQFDLKSGDLYYIQPEISFQYEFTDLFSTGVWKVELRDPIKDDDGRCLFRNATLRINGGEMSTLLGQPVASEAVTVTQTTGNYGVLPEIKGRIFDSDFGSFGVENMLINHFTFTQSFSVNSLRLQITLYGRVQSQVQQSVRILIIAPSGGYHMFSFGDLSPDSIPLGEGDLFHYDVSLAPAFFPSESSPLFGEPSQGTWSVCVMDVQNEGNTIDLVWDTTLFDITTVPPATPPNYPALTLSLAGVSYP